MSKATFSLNYRKPKSEYSENDEVFICIRKHLSSEQNASTIKQISSGVKCKISDWDPNWHKKPERSPIKKTDPDYLNKNNLLRKKATAFLKQTHAVNKKKQLLKHTQLKDSKWRNKK